MITHEAKFIQLHGKSIEIDVNMIEFITKINKTKLKTRGCCENHVDDDAYVIFEYDCFVELTNDNVMSNFFNEYCTKSQIYYANNDLRDIEYNETEYNEKFKNISEIWICIVFPCKLKKDFENIIEKIT